ncbi:MAG: class I SAM-dependent methyltransferase [Pseudomonadota bacterium]
MTFKDHFSQQAAIYAAHRPRYPEALYAWLAAQVPTQACAWDCATGNGQAARALATHFDAVIATDASAAQIDKARDATDVSYRVAAAEASGLTPASVDLITVAQALHWFETDAFYAHAQDVLKPAGVLAVWTYQLFEVEPAIDTLIAEFFDGPIGPYWPAERRFVDESYASILPDWPQADCPPFVMRCRWRLADVVGYLSSWSAVQRFKNVHGKDPVAALAPVLAPLWGDDVREVRWPLLLFAFRHPGA